MVKFVILSSQRTGSTFFRKYLGSHSAIDCRGELFIRKRSDAFESGEKYYSFCSKEIYRKILVNIAMSALIVPKFMDSFYSDSHPGVKAKGFKLMYNQYKKNNISMQILTQRNVRIIHFIRKNILKRLISQELLSVRGIAHSTEKLPVLKINLNTKTLLKRLRKMNDEVDLFRKKLAGIEHIEIYHEAFVTSPKAEIRKVLEFLEIDREEELFSNLKKINPSDIKKSLANYDDVEKVLSGSEFKDFLCQDK